MRTEDQPVFGQNRLIFAPNRFSGSGQKQFATGLFLDHQFLLLNLGTAIDH